MRSIQVQWLIARESEKPRIVQIYRQGLEYSLLSADNRQCCYFVWCKDFLQDAIQGSLYKTKKEIYKFHYDPATQPPVCLEKTRILLTNARDFTFGSKIPQCLDLLHQIEKQMGLRKTVVYQCENPSRKYKKCGVYCFEGSRLWQIAPPMLSFYTLLIRIGFIHTKGASWAATTSKLVNGIIDPYQSEDDEQFSDAKPGIQKILRYGPRRIFNRDIRINYPEKLNIETMHNDMGIVAFSGGDTEELVPYWHRY